MSKKFNPLRLTAISLMVLSAVCCIYLKFHSGWEIILGASGFTQSEHDGVYKFNLRPLANSHDLPSTSFIDNWLLKISLRSSKSWCEIFENGRPLQSDADLVRSPEKSIPGKYCKSDRLIYLTTGDGGDPWENGNIYQIRLFRIIGIRHFLPLFILSLILFFPSPLKKAIAYLEFHINAKLTNEVNSEWPRLLPRAALAFLLFTLFCLGFRVCFPTQYFDFWGFDYNITSASHAILFLENHEGTPNRGNLNIRSHPGLPYYAAMGLIRYISGVTEGDNAVERTVNFFRKIEIFWNFQAFFAALLAGLGAAFFSLYCRRVPLAVALFLLALPMANAISYHSYFYFYDLGNETFALPLIGVYLLLARRIFQKIQEPSRALIFALGAVGAVFYTVKMPYIIFFVAGFLVPFHLGLKSKNIKKVFSLTAIYLAGFISLLVAVTAVFGSEIIFAWLEYHYEVMTHTDLPGASERGGLLALSIMFKNLKYLGKFHLAIWPAWLSIGVLACLLYQRKLKPRNLWPGLLMAFIFALNVLVTLTHWRESYALVQPIILGFIIYELAEPNFLGGPGRSERIGWQLGALLVAFLCAYPGLKTFSRTLLDYVLLRPERIEMAREIEELPLNDDEFIYFHAHDPLPFFYLSDSLGLTYISLDGFDSQVLAKLFPGRRWLAKGNFRDYLADVWEIKNTAYDFSRICNLDRPELKIKYIVVLGWLLDQTSRGQPLLSYDNPHPRLVYEPEDRIVLRGGAAAVIEKALPIDLCSGAWHEGQI